MKTLTFKSTTEAHKFQRENPESPFAKSPLYGVPAGWELRASTKTLTYGTLPSFEEFEYAFRLNVEEGPRGKLYAMTLSENDAHMFESVGLEHDGKYVPSRLYALCEALVAIYNNFEASMSTREQAEWAGDFCSSILGTLSFEWC